MPKAINCPVCHRIYGAVCFEEPANGDLFAYNCEACGQYKITRSSLAMSIFKTPAGLTSVQRAGMSHAISRGAENGPVLITTDWAEAFLKSITLPLPSAQATNLLRVVGDHVRDQAESYVLTPNTASKIGVRNFLQCTDIAKELTATHLLRTTGHVERKNPLGGTVSSQGYDLTLDGWKQYENERMGKLSNKQGFLALKFNDPVLDQFVDEVLKPAIKTGIDYELIDMRSAARAGVIDNIMREQIRDSAFVIADLTHDNAGAYWEAGYAEGLGKPVIYICEKEKFLAKQSHFDTSHSTTVTWSATEHLEFSAEIVATLRRSLNLFPSN